jgi:hypothetical protein
MSKNPPPFQPPPYPWWDAVRRSTAAPADMRVSDAERQSMSECLSQHYADGRLDDAEFQERLGRAMSAKTRSDLSGLTYDLPRGDGEVAVPVPAPHHRRPWYTRVLVFAAVWLVIWTAIATLGSIWSWVALPAIGHAWLFITAIALFLMIRRSRRHGHMHPHNGHQHLGHPGHPGPFSGGHPHGHHGPGWSSDSSSFLA